MALGSDNMSGLLIDVTKHLGNLKYRVWEKIQDHIDYSEYTYLVFSSEAEPKLCLISICLHG